MAVGLTCHQEGPVEAPFALLSSVEGAASRGSSCTLSPALFTVRTESSAIFWFTSSVLATIVNVAAATDILECTKDKIL